MTTINLILDFLLLSVVNDQSIRWLEEWYRIHEEWYITDDITHDFHDDPTIKVYFTGQYGFRYGLAMEWAVIDLPISQIATPPKPGKLQKIYCSFDPKACNGVAYLAGKQTVRLMLSLNRFASRLATIMNLELLNEKSELFTQLPEILHGFDLDNLRYIKVPTFVKDPLCVQAEAKKLAQSELERISIDLKSGRIDSERSNKFNEKLSDYLASASELCKPGE